MISVSITIVRIMLKSAFIYIYIRLTYQLEWSDQLRLLNYWVSKYVSFFYITLQYHGNKMVLHWNAVWIHVRP